MRFQNITDRIFVEHAPFQTGTLQDGSLQKRMKELNIHSKEVLAKEKAIATMVRNTSDNLVDLVSASTETKAIQDAKDLTAAFLAPVVESKPSLPSSTFKVYRGIIRKLESMAVSSQHNVSEAWDERFAILGGPSASVLDAIVIHSSVAVAMESQELGDRWKGLGYVPLGLVVWDFTSDGDPARYKAHLMELDTSMASRLLLVFGKSMKMRCWELAVPTNGEAAGSSEPLHFQEVHLNLAGENRKKDEKYIVCNIEDLGVTFEDKASSMVQGFICKQLQASFQHVALKAENQRQLLHEFALFPVPADGLCFWHSINGSRDFDRWIHVPRKTNGYALNLRDQEHEESQARSLFESTVELSTHGSQDVALRGALLLEAHGVTDVTDVPWIAGLLGMQIRCTISKEAGTCCAYSPL